MDMIAGQFVASLKPFEFNEKVEPDDLTPKLTNEMDRRLRRSSSRQQIVDDQHPLAAFRSRPGGWPACWSRTPGCISLQNNRQAVFPACEPGTKPAPKPRRKHAAENKSSRLDPNDFGDPLSLITGRQFVGQDRERGGIFQERGDVVKENAGLGKVRHFANEGVIVDGGHGLEQVCLCHGLSLDGMAKPNQRSHFDLPNPLAGQPHLTADLFQRLGFVSRRARTATQ